MGEHELRLYEDLMVVTHAPLQNHSFRCYHSDWYSFGGVAPATRGACYSVWIPLVDVPAETRGGSVLFCNRSALPPRCSEAEKPFSVEGPCIAGESDGACERAMDSDCAAQSYRAGDAVLFSSDSMPIWGSIRA